MQGKRLFFSTLQAPTNGSVSRSRAGKKTRETSSTGTAHINWNENLKKMVLDTLERVFNEKTQFFLILHTYYRGLTFTIILEKFDCLLYAATARKRNGSFFEELFARINTQISKL